MDRTDSQLIEELTRDGRASLRMLGRRIGLSAPGVSARLSRLADTGAIEGYSARVNPEALGFHVSAFIRLSTRRRDLSGLFSAHPEITECHRLTGEDAFLLRVWARDTADLERIIDALMGYGDPTTSVVLSTPLSSRLPRAAPEHG
jgi:Lrp/AsnC family leucine-responsive transcriptional regulator